MKNLTKFRNKKTGEIVILAKVKPNSFEIYRYANFIKRYIVDSVPFKDFKQNYEEVTNEKI